MPGAADGRGSGDRPGCGAHDGAREAPRRVGVHVTGIVQGVGMRPFVYREAVAHGLAGWVLNAADGVHIEAQGPAGRVSAFVRALGRRAPAAARVDRIDVAELAPEPDGAPDPTGDGREPAFRIVASDAEGARTTLVSPDIATCPDCLRELFDPADRRYRYPFINCTNCGPRFTIIRSLPYDRPATSMDAFPMCGACAAEYADPGDRRFHAQPDACFACGPHITWRERAAADGLDAAGTPAAGRTREESDAIIDRCAALLAAGGIVAVKGLGGFHLACDAGCERAVRELRRRKHRGRKPLAVMVRSLDDAGALCEADDAERALLAGSVRPIVLLRRRPAVGMGDGEHAGDAAGAPRIAPSVAFDLPELGVMLPYTPLQHLLLAACADRGVRALVMTSGNLAGEPIEVDDGAAWERLCARGVADALLGNDRAILARYDDSVVRVVRGALVPVRRARGYAPRPLPLPPLPPGAVEPPCILACGPEQKAALALTRGDGDGRAALCFVSQHVGDVEGASVLEAWHGARRRIGDLFGLDPGALACDAHPSYLTSRWARGRAADRGLPLVEVQHHHAHIASVIAEAAARGDIDPALPVVGVALDGTGAGDDGTVWGGEVMTADLTRFDRVAHLRRWRLPGGSASIREPRRSALSLLAGTGLLGYPGAAPLVGAMGEPVRRVTLAMVERGVNSPLTSSMGRLFDAVAALLGICGEATYEGEPACLLEAAAQRARRSAPLAGFRLLSPEAPGLPRVIDTVPVLRSLLEGVSDGVPVDELARGFHESAARMVAQAAAETCREAGIRTVALSGGVFMNRLLLERSVELLEAAGITVLVPRDVPVNDGCIAYGQAAVARARLAARGAGAVPSSRST